MDLDLRGLADELVQLAFWLEVLSRQDTPPDDAQLDLLEIRIDSLNRRVGEIKHQM